MRSDRAATVMRKRLWSSLRFPQTVCYTETAVVTEEPYEGNLHVRICGGRRGQPRLLPGSRRKKPRG